MPRRKDRTVTVVSQQWKLLEMCPLHCQGKLFMVRHLPRGRNPVTKTTQDGCAGGDAAGRWVPMALSIAGPGAKRAISPAEAPRAAEPTQQCRLQKLAESTPEPEKKASSSAMSLPRPLQTNLNIVPRDKKYFECSYRAGTEGWVWD